MSFKALAFLAAAVAAGTLDVELILNRHQLTRSRRWLLGGLAGVVILVSAVTLALLWGAITSFLGHGPTSSAASSSEAFGRWQLAVPAATAAGRP